MEKTVKLSTLSAVIESTCNSLLINNGFTKEECMTFVVNLMENLAKGGWKIVED